MTVRNPLPKALRLPANGLDPADEPDDLKAVRLLAALRHLAHGKYGILGMTIDGVGIMLIKHDPTRHNLDADLTGADL